MSQEIVLNGVALSELRKQIGAIRKDAVKFIADNIDKVKPLVTSLKEAMEEFDDESQDTSKLESIATELLPLLKDIQLVSNVTGVEYYIGYSDEWCSNGDVITRILEDFYCEPGALGDLYDLAENMEYDVRNWNTSTC